MLTRTQKTQILDAKYKKMMDGFEHKVKTEQEVEQDTKLTDVRIPIPYQSLEERD